MHSFGDWLRQIKGDTGKGKKKSATARQCGVYVGVMGGGRGLFQKQQQKSPQPNKNKVTVTQKEEETKFFYMNNR